MRSGCRYGSHRVVEPKGVLPQPAWKLDNTPQVCDNEILVDVETLNIDAASFTQLEGQAEEELRAAGAEPSQEAVCRRIGELVLKIVEERGKMHNPVTGSGGVLRGKVLQVGPAIEAKVGVQPGDKISTLVSLSLTPLKLYSVKAVHREKDQIDVEGRAIIFESGIFAKLPDDMPESLALAVLDVAGAPAQTARLVKPGDLVFVIGAGGKSGLLCLYEAKKRAGVTGTVVGMAHSEASMERARALGCADALFAGDATDALGTMRKFLEVTGGKKADVVINCVNIPRTEMASILCARDGGTIYFFSMATSFTAAALGAEGVGADVSMIIGNGYARGHAEIALHVLRECPKLRQMFEELFA
ncbi:MAG: zinc-binding dehydrogenase [Bacillota bacterium]